MLRSAGWESVQAVWPLHARLFAAVAGKGISALDMHPRKLPTRYAAGFRYLDGPACAVARLGAYAHRTASDYLDEPATAGSAHGFIVRAIECGLWNRLPTARPVWIGRSWTCWPVGQLVDLPDKSADRYHRPQCGLRKWERNSPTSRTAGTVSLPHRPTGGRPPTCVGVRPRPCHPPGTAIPARPQTARGGPTVPPTRRTQSNY